MKKKRIIIIGAAGRDFHNFNVYFRNDPTCEVVGFTAAQIPDIEGRTYPPELAGEHYPDGIPIYAQDDLPELIRKLQVDECIFSYSDISYKKMMSLASIVNMAGASFSLLGPRQTMVKSNKPLISVCATRTGCGKSQTTRKVIEVLMKEGYKVIAIRHPMPYGDLARQKVQRFASLEDLKKHDCTIEEMEEYEPHIIRGNVIYAGVDYEAILRAAEEDPDGCDVIVWDGGNNDFSFYQSDLYITVADPHRAGDEVSYYAGETNLRLSDVVIINKMDTADESGVRKLKKNIKKVVSDAIVIEADSPVRVDDADLIRGKRVLVVEDGPTLTHGGMKIGAGSVAAEKFGASTVVDPRPFLKGKLRETFEIYPEIGRVLPAMGYSARQLEDLEATINAVECDTVVIGTPIDLTRVIAISKPATRVYYDLEERRKPNLKTVLEQFKLSAGITRKAIYGENPKDKSEPVSEY